MFALIALIREDANVYQHREKPTHPLEQPSLLDNMPMVCLATLEEERGQK